MLSVENVAFGAGSLSADWLALVGCCRYCVGEMGFRAIAPSSKIQLNAVRGQDELIFNYVVV